MANRKPSLLTDVNGMHRFWVGWFIIIGTKSLANDVLQELVSISVVLEAYTGGETKVLTRQ